MFAREASSSFEGKPVSNGKRIIISGYQVAAGNLKERTRHPAHEPKSGQNRPREIKA